MDEGFLTMDGFLNSPSGRVLLVVLAVGVTAAVIPLVFAVNLTIQPWALKLAAVAGLGAVAGLTARRLLGDYTPALRLLAALLALFTGLWLLGWLSHGYLGFQLLQFPAQSLNWDWLGQLILGGLVAWLTLSAWQVSTPAKKVVRKPGVKPASGNKPLQSGKTTKGTGRGPGKTPHRRDAESAEKRHKKEKQPGLPRVSSTRPVTPSRQSPPGVAPQTSWTARWKRLQGQVDTQLRATAQDLRASGRTAVERLRTRLASRPAETKVQLHRRPLKIRASQPAASPVHLVGEMEHRCPYCLELVQENDPRGVQTCPICQTRHHGDCWAVTGMCQVPHHYE